MAQTGYTPISLYYSSTASATPTAGNLVPGELAINTADGKLFYKDSAGVVQVIASKSTGTAGGSNTQVQYNSSGSLAGSANMTFDGSNLSVAGVLNVGGSTGANTLNLFGATGAGMRIGNTTTGNSYYITSQSGDNITSNVGGTGYYTWYTGGGEKLRLDNTGNLGIGTSSPNISAVDKALTINGTNNSIMELAYGGTRAAYLYANSAATILSGVPAGGILQFNTVNTERMRIDSSGNVGIGTSSPNGKLSILSPITAQALAIWNRASDNGYGGIYFKTSDGATDQCVITNERSGTNGANLLVYTKPDGGSITTRLVIDANGKVGINTTTPGGRLDVRANSGQTALEIYGNNLTTARLYPSIGYRGWSIENGGTGETTDGMYYAFNGTAGSTSWAYFGAQSAVSGVVYKVYGNGNVVNLNNSYGSISDIKLKENIVDATPKLDQLCQLKVRNYNFIKTPEQKQLGLIAQEVEQIFPSMIEQVPDRDENGQIIEGEFTKNIKYSVFVPMLLKAIQELNDKVMTLEAKVKG